MQMISWGCCLLLLPVLPCYSMSQEERIMSLGAAVEDSEFVYIMRSRLHSLLKNMRRNPEMYESIN